MHEMEGPSPGLRGERFPRFLGSLSRLSAFTDHLTVFGAGYPTTQPRNHVPSGFPPAVSISPRWPSVSVTCIFYSRRASPARGPANIFQVSESPQLGPQNPNGYPPSQRVSSQVIHIRDELELRDRDRGRCGSTLFASAVVCGQTWFASAVLHEGDRERRAAEHQRADHQSAGSEQHHHEDEPENRVPLVPSIARALCSIPRQQSPVVTAGRCSGRRRAGPFGPRGLRRPGQCRGHGRSVVVGRGYALCVPRTPALGFPCVYCAPTERPL